MNSMITLTDAAIEHLTNLVAQDDTAIGFRLSLKKTGCSGYAYQPDIIKNALATDIHFSTRNLAVYIDPACEKFIQGLVIDYVIDENNKILKQKRLVFINPQEKNRCGCGESFTIEKLADDV
jgi:iron-sulfur cluster assembly protein